ncbi:MAG: GAF domain-containing protein [Pedobacter sp.]|nr:MAG: GAF domain-containing protein [Pedobacter sp.]
MLKVPSPSYPLEEQRLTALYSYDVLGEGLKNELDNLVKLAAQIASTKKAYISFVDKEHIVFKAAYGLITQARIFSRAGSICQRAMFEDIYVVPDIRLSNDFVGNALLHSHENIAFYASVPLKDLDGYPLGCLAVKVCGVFAIEMILLELLPTLKMASKVDLNNLLKTLG